MITKFRLPISFGNNQVFSYITLCFGYLNIRKIIKKSFSIGFGSFSTRVPTSKYSTTSSFSDKLKARYQHPMTIAIDGLWVLVLTSFLVIRALHSGNVKCYGMLEARLVIPPMEFLTNKYVELSSLHSSVSHTKPAPTR